MWKEGIKSEALLSGIYSYLLDTYGIDRYEADTILDIHDEYNTLVIIDGKGFARYNIEGTVAYILDCIVVDGGVHTLRKMCKLGQDKFPYAKTIRFERALKKRKDMRHFTLNNFIKEVL